MAGRDGNAADWSFVREVLGDSICSFSVHRFNLIFQPSSLCLDRVCHPLLSHENPKCDFLQSFTSTSTSIDPDFSGENHQSSLSHSLVASNPLLNNYLTIVHLPPLRLLSPIVRSQVSQASFILGALSLTINISLRDTLEAHVLRGESGAACYDSHAHF